MYELLDRLYHPKMEYYRETYRNSERWNYSESLENKTVIVYGEQGNGDIIQFARYLPLLKGMAGRVLLHGPECLRELLSPLVDDYLDKDDPNLPTHDYHIPSMSLPFAINQTYVEVPYISIDAGQPPDGWDSPRIGIAWEGNPGHTNTDQRNCPLKYFLPLQKRGRLYSLQPLIHDVNLLVGAEDCELYGTDMENYAQTARFLKHLDYVVSVDTSVLHLAGALGVPTYGLLSQPCDGRWDVMNWYPSIRFLRQDGDGDWDPVFAELEWLLDNEKRGD